MPRERIGLMGGSFNPIHQRHLDIALEALRSEALDRVVFLPTGNPPHKRDGLADAEHRYEMTRLTLLGVAGMGVSRAEIDREGVIYTVDTLARFQRQMPGADFFYLIGEDTLHDLPNWRKPDKVFTMCRFLVCPRESAADANAPIVRELTARGARIAFLRMPPVDVSSTAVRAAIARGEQPPALNPLVMEYIRLMGLYGARQSPPGAPGWYPKLRAALTDKRLVHSLLVTATARRLARLHSVDEDTAACAALLHDCAKCMPLSAMQRVAKERRLLVDHETMESGNLLHGPVGAVIAETEYGVSDPNVLSAIRCHTTGKVGMLPLDMIVYLADKIEPSRRGYPTLERVRALADADLVEAMRCSLLSTQAYVRQQKAELHPATQRVVDWLARLGANGAAKTPTALKGE